MNVKEFSFKSASTKPLSPRLNQTKPYSPKQINPKLLSKDKAFKTQRSERKKDDNLNPLILNHIYQGIIQSQKKEFETILKSN